MEEAPLDAESDRARSRVSGLPLGKSAFWISFGRMGKLDIVIHSLHQHHSQGKEWKPLGFTWTQAHALGIVPCTRYYILFTCFYLNIKIIKQHIEKTDSKSDCISVVTVGNFGGDSLLLIFNHSILNEPK